MSQLKAPNGKPSNLTPEQWKLVRTPQFKAWFGDWENDPENASEIVDENGEPLVVYHGSKSNEEFNVFKQSSRFEFIYFAKTKEYAWFHFTKDIIDKPFQLRPFFLNIRNLLNGEEYGFEKVDFSELKSFFYGIHELSKDIQLNPKSQYRFWEVLRFSNDIYDSLKNQDYYDGISFYENFYDNTTWNDTDDYSLSYVVMNPNQIKLADGTNTTFDGNNPDIRFAEGGKTKRYMKKIKRGGITYGKSHAEGGIPVKNQSTGDMLEVEGGEGIVNKRSMASKSKVKLNGKDLTICQAVSELNQMEGGVQFSCEDVSDRQFIRAMAKGGELDRGTRTEQEHIQVLKDLYAKRITPKQASERIAKDHLKEDSQYYSKLAKMEGKMADGGNVKKVKFSIEQDDEEDRIKISIKGIGEIILVETTPKYEFLEDIGEDGLEELNLNEDDFIGKIEHIEIADNFKGKGYAKILMNKAIAVAKEKGLMPLYLNASPMGFKGLNTTDLTAFYESFGFEVFLYQGHNNLMILNSSSNAKMADGGKTRKNAKTTLKEEVGFDINSIDISKL